jgi:hypothetical protein
MPLDLVGTTEGKKPIRLAPKTHSKKDAKIDGLAKITILTGGATSAVATPEEIAADEAAGKPGLQGFVISEDIAGVSTYEVEADVDLGSGVKTIKDGGTYTYSDPLAENLGLSSDDDEVPKN